MRKAASCEAASNHKEDDTNGLIGFLPKLTSEVLQALLTD
ncbi:hypothetical protein ACPOL_4014 [Acidisarcina polymorpha]|uniref:Uncharacterized protein n=1 Tax=Acidisarcina polymorpha TaxID=2211140 RepID=A0A2Z5G282_9BACT|nr:hypothetical protein ACPOL_4014 [Acidisarcina polymorpha]